MKPDAVCDATNDSAYEGRRRLMVSGSRAGAWQNPTEVKRGILSRLKTFNEDGWVVMHGGAMGVDAWVGEACEITGHDVQVYRPSRDLPSPQRFHERNDRMLDAADFVFAVWDGSTRGTGSVIEKARKRGLELWVWLPEGSAADRAALASPEART